MASAKKLPACSDASTLAELLAQRCEDHHTEKDGWRARCPNHQGTSDTSLSITPSADRVLLHCFGGCTPEAVVEALGFHMADLFVQTQTPHTRKARRPQDLGPIMTTYEYVNRDGTCLHQTVRYAPHGVKTFRQRRPDPLNPHHWLSGLGTIEPVLYHLPEVVAAIQNGTPIYLVEGEKDADMLQSKGLVATTNAMGAGAWRPSYTETLRGANVILLADYDPAGQRHMDTVARALLGTAATIKVIHAFHTDTPKSDITDWIDAGGSKEAFDAIVAATDFYTRPAVTQTPVGWSVNGIPGATITEGIQSAPWRKQLFSKKNGELTQNVLNIMRILEHHEHWRDPRQALWWDSVRGSPMCGDAEITDARMMDLATWFGTEERLPITSPRLLEQCVIAHCKKQPRDLLQLWLNSLPAWDGIPRLTTWLVDIAHVTLSDYVADTSRVLVTSMVARAIDPGCHYRFVVILEGPEAIGKSALVRALASPEWFVELSIGLETKEAHMMLQGAWVAELADLDSMTRTEETRMKAFITMRQDSYIPKYSNFRQRTERRAIFVGTTNDESYLKGLSGNTRYLPLRIEHAIDLAQFLDMRPMLFAEALRYYHAHPDTWWSFGDEALETAKEQRERRRVLQVYEHPLHEWLEYTRLNTDYFDEKGRVVTFLPEETSWQEIAKYFLKLDSPEKWKDRSLQMQIASALKELGWKVDQAWRSGRNMNIWQKVQVPF